jgi:hypothetical protein
MARDPEKSAPPKVQEAIQGFKKVISEMSEREIELVCMAAYSPKTVHPKSNEPEVSLACICMAYSFPTRELALWRATDFITIFPVSRRYPSTMLTTNPSEALVSLQQFFVYRYPIFYLLD